MLDWLAAQLSLGFWALCVFLVIVWTPYIVLYRLATRHRGRRGRRPDRGGRNGGVAPEGVAAIQHEDPGPRDRPERKP